MSQGGNSILQLCFDYLIIDRWKKAGGRAEKGGGAKTKCLVFRWFGEADDCKVKLVDILVGILGKGRRRGGVK